MSIGGFSVIHRCSANFTTDGAAAARGVNYNFNDKFCLDGQRLVVVGGSYGAAGSEYRTERDSFTRIVAQGAAGNGPQSFVAYTKSGQIMYYGDTSDSRIMPIIGGAIASTPRVWALRAVFDRFNNYTTFSYFQDTTNGAYYPTSISYTGNTSTERAPYNSIQFQYEARSDVVNQYVGVAKVTFPQRLASVLTYANTSTLVRSYRLIYQTAPVTGASVLTTINECGGDGVTCLPASTFTYAGGGIHDAIRTNTYREAFISNGSQHRGNIQWGIPSTKSIQERWNLP